MIIRHARRFETRSLSYAVPATSALLQTRHRSTCGESDREPTSRSTARTVRPYLMRTSRKRK
jgi:hypothetical protein